MAYQTGSNILVALKRESSIGVEATGTGASQLRIVDSPGLVLNRAVIESQEKRADAVANMGRLGYKTVEGSFNSELSAGGATDILLEAVMRSTWATSTTIAATNVTSMTFGTNEIVAGGSSWLTYGIKVGDVFTLSGCTETANNGQNFQVTAVTTATLSVKAAAFTAAGADTGCDLTVRRKVVTNTSAPTRYSHTVEQYDSDIDLSEVFTGCRMVGLRLSGRPGEYVTAQYTFLGMDRDAKATGTSPHFSSPTLTTTLGLVADDSSILKDGVAVSDFTGFDLNFEITARGEPVIGSLTPPDIFDNDLRVTGSITSLRDDFANLTLYDAETEFELNLLLEEPTGSPPECVGIYLPRVKISGLNADVGGGDGAKIETINLFVGPKASATGYDATVAAFFTTGP
jgi:hypothetical protein